MAAGVNVMFNHFPAIIAGMDSKVEAAVAKIANEIAASAKAKAPVDTGALQSSISAQSVGKQRWEVSANIRYARYVEYGTKNHGGPQPFMTPAAHEAEPNLIVEVAKAIEP